MIVCGKVFSEEVGKKVTPMGFRLKFIDKIGIVID